MLQGKYASMETDDFEGHFEFMKPLAQITRFEVVDFDEALEMYVTKCSDFFKEGSIRIVMLGNASFDSSEEYQ